MKNLKIETQSIEDGKILEEFFDFLRYVKKMKQNTFLSYRRDIGGFLEYCKEMGSTSVLKSVDFFESYMDKLRSCGKSSATLSRNIASLRNFFRFLKDSGYTDVNPTYGVKYEKKVKTQEKNDVLTTDEIDSLIRASKGTGFKALRDEAVIETLYACGLKVTELINLKLDDLFLDDGYIRITEDGAVRYVPIYKGAVKAVRNYIHNARVSVTADKRNTFLFLNKNAQPLTRQGLWKILKTYGKKADIEKEITPHLIRRSMAVHLMENGAALFDVKEILGHKNISLTKDYVKKFKPSVISAYEKAHPKA